MTYNLALRWVTYRQWLTDIKRRNRKSESQNFRSEKSSDLFVFLYLQVWAPAVPQNVLCRSFRDTYICNTLIVYEYLRESSYYYYYYSYYYYKHYCYEVNHKTGAEAQATKVDYLHSPWKNDNVIWPCRPLSTLFLMFRHENVDHCFLR